MKKPLIQLVMLLLLSFTYQISYAQSLMGAVLCENVEDLEAQRATTAFREGSTAFCWLKVKEAPINSYLYVEWYADGKLRATVKLDLPYGKMRTYASKILGEQGQWKAIVRRKDGLVLKELSFLVGRVRN